MRKFQAGNLDRKILILRRTKSKARSGQDVINYVQLGECSAGISPESNPSGTEKNEDKGIYEIGKITFLIRHRKDLKTDMVIFFDTLLSNADFDAIDFDTVDFNTEAYQDKIYNIKTFYEPQNTRRQWLFVEAVLKI